MSVVVYDGPEFEYGLTRTKNTIIMGKDGVPYYIHSGDEDEYEVRGFPMKEGQYANAKNLGVGWDFFSFLSPKLGYANLPNKRSATYVSRMASRHYKQGLSPQNIKGHPFQVGLLTHSLYNTIMNKYPSSLVAYEKVICKEVVSWAFCRNFAFSYYGDNADKTYLLYREKRVGTAKYNPHANVINFTLDPEYSFLEEILQESVGHV